jgi:ABC-type polysaccharide/polyol phosphate transport system ATPase subunit
MIVQTTKARKYHPLRGLFVATVSPVSAILSEDRPADRRGPHPPERFAVRVEHLAKTFRLPREQYHTFKERALHPLRARHYDLLQAVDDVSVEIAPGEFFGIVGRNGSGKSTLLKCLAGIYRVDSGSLAINGRLSPFIELGVGFNPDLPARDNVIINAIMLGLSRQQARERFDDILAFAELEEFVDLKLKNYSSGMYVRLAFATAVQVDADILLIDEVLAVGDAAFQQKCFDEFTRLQAAGKTILFVTHDMGSVERFCDRVMLLERGRVVDIGEPESIARQYNHINFHGGRPAAQHLGVTPAAGPEKPVAQILNAWFQSPDGEVIITADQGETCEIRLQVRFLAAATNPIFEVRMQGENGHFAYATNTESRRIESGQFEAGAVATVRFRFDNWLAPGRYRLVATVARMGAGADIYDIHTESTLIVLADRAGGGTVDLPTEIEIEGGQG